MKTLLTLFFILSILQVYSQESFVDYLIKQELKKDIDYQIISDNFKIDTLWKTNMGTRFFLESKFLDKENNMNIVILREDNGVGSIAFLYSFTNSGNIIDNHKIMEAFDNSDLYGPNYDFFYSLENKLVTINHQLDIPVQPTKEEPDNTRIAENFKTYVQIKKHGYFFELTEKNPPKDKRLFKYASRELMPIAYLERLTDDDLLIMRNEIYASHGYRFKTEKLKAYFGDLEWYSGEFDNVDDVLGTTEKENIERIKLIEKE